MDNPDHLRAFLKERGATTYFHPVGTCSMGSTEASVTDTRLRIHGAEGPRVVDASVMPSIPAANPHPTVLAVAERAADMIRTQHG